MIKTAVILAAGLGSRINEFSKFKPKGFIEINGISLIERSINILLDYGISKIYIGTGYKAIFYDNLKKLYSSIITKKNHEYEISGSFHTLYNFKDILNDNFLLLESDILYQNSAITSLLGDNKSNIILTSNLSKSEDEVFVIEDKNKLIKLTKIPSKDEKPSSEFIGISKISKSLFNKMCLKYKSLNNKNLEYEELLNMCSDSKEIDIKNLKDIAWCEIDNNAHLSRATNIVFPKIIQNEKSKKNIT